MHVGLGRATRVRELRITWPDSSRTKSTFADLEVKRSYRVVQGSAPVIMDRAPVAFRKVPLTKPPMADQH